MNDELMSVGRPSSADAPAGLFLRIGETSSEMVLSSSSGPVVETTWPTGTETFDRSVLEHLKRRHQLILGERTLEVIRQQVGCAQPPQSEITVEIKGRNLLGGAPTVVTMTSTEFLAATARVRSQVLEFVRDAIAGCPPELAEVIHEHGIVIAGDGAALRGLTSYLADGTGIPARLGT